MIPECSICNIEMVFKEKVKTKKHYRIRRFECPVCGNIETIFADGEKDLKIYPEIAIRHSERQFEQEKKNRYIE